MAATLYSVRLLLRGLGESRYAAYTLLAGLGGWFSLLDMGMGGALQSAVAKRRARGESHGPEVRWALLFVGSAAALVIVVLALASTVLGGRYLRNTGLAPAAAGAVFLLAGSLLALTAAGGVAYRIWYAEERGHVANAVSVVPSLVSVALLASTQRLGVRGTLSGSLLVMLGPATVAAVGSALVVTMRSDRLPAIDPTRRSELTRSAFRFLGIATIASAVLQADLLVLAWFLDARQIVVYAIATKVFDSFSILYGSAMVAFWPRCAAMIQRRDWAGVFRAVRLQTGLGMSGVVVFGAFALAGMPLLLRILAPGRVLVVPYSLTIYLAILTMIRIWTNTFAVVLQSADRVRAILIGIPIQAVINAAMQWWLAPRLGASGVVLALAVSYALTVAWILPAAVLRVSREAKVTSDFGVARG